MTEIGMALSNSLHGERFPGFVGLPLPGVTARLVDQEDESSVLLTVNNEGAVVTPSADSEGASGDVQGLLEIMGPTVFSGGFAQD
jgi:acyl-CoA synthetase (AMP-forming)/AMP-acid ligase II